MVATPEAGTLPKIKHTNSNVAGKRKTERGEERNREVSGLNVC